MIRWDSERRGVIIDGRLIRLTTIEYQLLFCIRSGEPVLYADLAATLYNCQMNANIRVILDKHVDRIRSKLRGSGMYIYCILNLGYLFLPEADPVESGYRAPKRSKSLASPSQAHKEASARPKRQSKIAFPPPDSEKGAEELYYG